MSREEMRIDKRKVMKCNDELEDVDEHCVTRSLFGVIESTYGVIISRQCGSLSLDDMQRICGVVCIDKVNLE